MKWIRKLMNDGSDEHRVNETNKSVFIFPFPGWLVNFNSGRIYKLKGKGFTYKSFYSK